MFLPLPVEITETRTNRAKQPMNEFRRESETWLEGNDATI